MKKIITSKLNKLLLVFCIIIISESSLIAKEVPSNLAKTVAENFYKPYSKSENLSVELKYTAFDSNGSPLYYAFNVNNKGFVIVSAEDAGYPIIGYSNEQTFEIPEAHSTASFWLSKRSEEIKGLKVGNVHANTEITSKWNQYSFSQAHNKNAATTSQTVSPLISTKWNQSPYYNALCPGNSLTGCVATAMSQIMKYWVYPAHGTGSSSYLSNYGTLSVNYSLSNYNWNNMPNSISSQNADVAKINYDCGVSVEMMYSPTLSGAYVVNSDNPISAENSYVTYFGYDPATILGTNRGFYTDAVWLSMLKNDLNLSRPVQYAGFGGAGGHTWICDGYDENDFFHMNWGWGGSSDGFYNIDGLNPSGFDFNSWQQGLFGILPLASNSIDAAVVSISAISNGCTSKLYSPKVKIRNYGINALTSCNINYVLDNGSVQTIPWSGSLVTGQSDNVTITNYTLANGAHSFTCYITNANNGIDGNSTNDVSTYNFSTFSSDNLPISEGFENPTTTSSHWSIVPSASADWAFTNQAFSSGTQALMVNNLANTPGNVSILQGLNNYDFSTTTDPFIYFKVAYQQKATNNIDKLELQISNNCGATWWTKWSKQGSALATTTVLSSSSFVPLPSDFKRYMLPAVVSSNTIFRWVFTADVANPGNNIYLDDINIYDTSAVSTVGIKQNITNAINLQLYPNPANGEVFLTFNLDKAFNVEVNVFDICGKEALTIENTQYNSGTQTISLNKQSLLAKGIYLLAVSLDGVKSTRKLIVN